MAKSAAAQSDSVLPKATPVPVGIPSYCRPEDANRFDEIFRRVAASRNIPLEPDSCDNLRKLCLTDGRTELRACYPVDICNILTSIGRYEKKPITITKSDIERAAGLYFAKAGY